MSRLIFADYLQNSGSNDETIIGGYTVPINPLDHTEKGLDNFSAESKLGGEATYVYGVFQGEKRTWTWKGLPVETKYLDMVNVLREYRGKYKLMRMGSAATEHKDEWLPVLILDVQMKYEKAPGINKHFAEVRVDYTVVRDWVYSVGDITLNRGLQDTGDILTE